MPRELRAPIFASVACAFMVLAVAAVFYKLGPAVHLDASLVERLAKPEGTSRYEFAAAVTDLVNPLPFLVILTGIVALGLFGGRPQETVAAVVLVLGANVSTQVLKHLLEHERYQWVLGMEQPSPDSFPSGHTTAAASLAVALVLVLPPRLRPLAAAVGAVFTLAVGTGLVVIKAHFPSDVLGGLFVVGAWSFAVIAALVLWRRRGPAAARKGSEETSSGRFLVSPR